MILLVPHTFQEIDLGLGLQYGQVLDSWRQLSNMVQVLGVCKIECFDRLIFNPIANFLDHGTNARAISIT